MRPADLPPDEPARLRRLRDYDVLDTPPEQAFDDLAELAAYICDCPIALVSLVDECRQWFKSRVGLDAPETPRDIAFCPYALHSPQNIFEVEDAAKDQRFFDNPLVTGPPHIRFYAGAPLVAPDGLALGTLCVIDRKPRRLNADQRSALQALARQAAAQLELRQNAVREARMRAELDRRVEDLRASEQKQRSILGALEEGVVMHAADGAILTSNASARRILGLTEDQLSGRTSFDPRWRSVREDGSPFPGEEHPAIVSLRTGRAITKTIMGIHKPDGALTWISINSQPLFREGEGKPYAAVASFIDVTIEREIHRRLEEARMQAESANRAKSDFLAAMSHEIRTPLNAIVGVADLLSETSLDEEQREYVEIFRRSGDHLLDLINDVLDIARIEAGKIAIVERRFSIPDLLERCLEFLRLRAAEKGLIIHLEIAPDTPEDVIGDSQRIRQILINLMGNAIKFTDSGEINVRVERENDNPQGAELDLAPVRFSIEDTGIGIEESQLESMFEPFTQADQSASRRHTGTGLGLAISRRMVHLMNGRIEARSRPGEGSCFSFCVPLKLPADAAQLQEATAASEAEPRHPLRLLLVDDNVDNLLLLQAFLRKSPYSIQTAENGAQAVDLVRRNEYDVVLMDVQMSVMDGLSAARAIRAWEAEAMATGARSRPTCIVALTAHAFTEDERKSLEAGCDRHLSKPISKRTLLEFLKEAEARLEYARRASPARGGN